jgi:hypothetical protein
MQRVASNHFLGVLVIDEIQRLSFSKTGGSKKALNFDVLCLTKLFQCGTLFTNTQLYLRIALSVLR